LYQHAARAQFAAKHFKEAIVHYQAALDLAPNDFDTMLGLVRVWMAQRQYAQAEAFLGRQLATLDGPPELYVALGLVYREAQQAHEALRAFEQAVGRRDEYAQAHFYLAAQLDQLGQPPDARFQLRRTIELEPTHADAMNYLGYMDAEEGVNLSEARALIERALEFDPDNGAFVDSLGWVYFKMGKLEEAIEQLERAAARLDDDPVIFDHLGDAYFKRGEPEKARLNWEHSLTLNPNQPAIQDKLNQLAPQEAIVTSP
jgi:tetratricopeptide (TPR) repeat protein